MAALPVGDLFLLGDLELVPVDRIAKDVNSSAMTAARPGRAVTEICIQSRAAVWVSGRQVAEREARRDDGDGDTPYQEADPRLRPPTGEVSLSALCSQPTRSRSSTADALQT
jgi:hypothetical protein